MALISPKSLGTALHFDAWHRFPVKAIELGAQVADDVEIICCGLPK
jgi:hypothetical protein